MLNASARNSNAMGKAIDASKNDDSFYLPPENYNNAEFKKGMKNFISPDGHAVRFIISHDGDPMSQEGISHIAAIKKAAYESLKGTPLEGSKIYLAGTASIYKDLSDGNTYDLLIAGIASLCLIFIIMLIITRGVVASAVACLSCAMAYSFDFSGADATSALGSAGFAASVSPRAQNRSLGSARLGSRRRRCCWISASSKKIPCIRWFPQALRCTT